MGRGDIDNERETRRGDVRYRQTGSGEIHTHTHARGWVGGGDYRKAERHREGEEETEEIEGGGG